MKKRRLTSALQQRQARFRAGGPGVLGHVFPKIGVERLLIPGKKAVEIAVNQLRQNTQVAVFQLKELPDAVLPERIAQGADYHIHLLLHGGIVYPVLPQGSKGILPGDAGALPVHQIGQQLLGLGAPKGQGLPVHEDFEMPEGVGSVSIPGGEPLHGGFHTVNYPVDPAVSAAVFVPDYELSTEKAREALPKEVAYRDAVYNVSRVGLLPAAMNPVEGVEPNALMYVATQDKLHQQYRAPLMQPSTDLIALFRSHGYAAAVSGAGPCVLVLHYGDAREAIDKVAAEQLASGHWKVLHLPINTKGVEVERS